MECAMEVATSGNAFKIFQRHLFLTAMTGPKNQ